MKNKEEEKCSENYLKLFKESILIKNKKRKSRCMNGWIGWWITLNWFTKQLEMEILLKRIFIRNAVTKVLQWLWFRVNSMKYLEASLIKIGTLTRDIAMIHVHSYLIKQRNKAFLEERRRRICNIELSRLLCIWKWKKRQWRIRFDN